MFRCRSRRYRRCSRSTPGPQGGPRGTFNRGYFGVGPTSTDVGVSATLADATAQHVRLRRTLRHHRHPRPWGAPAAAEAMTAGLLRVATLRARRSTQSWISAPRATHLLPWPGEGRALPRGHAPPRIPLSGSRANGSLPAPVCVLGLAVLCTRLASDRRRCSGIPSSRRPARRARCWKHERLAAIVFGTISLASGSPKRST